MASEEMVVLVTADTHAKPQKGQGKFSELPERLEDRFGRFCAWAIAVAPGVKVIEKVMVEHEKGDSRYGLGIWDGMTEGQHLRPVS